MANEAAGIRSYNSLFWYLKQGRYDQLQGALVAGANVNQCNPAGNTPLMKAFLYGQYRFVCLLLQYGADTFHRNRKGQSLRDWVRQGYRFRFRGRAQRPDFPNHALTSTYLITYLNHQARIGGKMEEIITLGSSSTNTGVPARHIHEQRELSGGDDPEEESQPSPRTELYFCGDDGSGVSAARPYSAWVTERIPSTGRAWTLSMRRAANRDEGTSPSDEDLVTVAPGVTICDPPELVLPPRPRERGRGESFLASLRDCWGSLFGD